MNVNWIDYLFNGYNLQLLPVFRRLKVDFPLFAEISIIGWRNTHCDVNVPIAISLYYDLRGSQKYIAAVFAGKIG